MKEGMCSACYGTQKGYISFFDYVKVMKCYGARVPAG
jgi:hypothetical protein